jgi:hypothetical protein
LSVPHLGSASLPPDPLPKRHRKALLDLYRADYEAFNYPIPR